MVRKHAWWAAINPVTLEITGFYAQVAVVVAPARDGAAVAMVGGNSGVQLQISKLISDICVRSRPQIRHTAPPKLSRLYPFVRQGIPTSLKISTRHKGRLEKLAKPVLRQKISRNLR